MDYPGNVRALLALINSKLGRTQFPRERSRGTERALPLVPPDIEGSRTQTDGRSGFSRSFPGIVGDQLFETGPRSISTEG